MITLIILASILLVVAIKTSPQVTWPEFKGIFTKQRVILCLVVVLCATVPPVLVNLVQDTFGRKVKTVVVVCSIDSGLLGINCK